MTARASSPAPQILAFEGPDQIVRGAQIELRWRLGGGAPAQLTLNGKKVSGSSIKVTPDGDPTRYTLSASNASGVSTADKWVGTHAPGECVSDFVTVGSESGQLLNPRWQRSGAAASLGYAHSDDAELVVDIKGDGLPVRFVVEQERDGAWSTYQELSVVSRGGTAKAQVTLRHPAATARSRAPLPHARFRFHAELAA